jgi:hypothetical protein
MKIDPTKFRRNSTREAEISEEEFSGGEYDVWFEVPKVKEKDGKTKKSQDEGNEEKDNRTNDKKIVVEVTVVYNSRMDINVSVAEGADLGVRDLHVASKDGDDKFVLKGIVEIIE